MFLSSFLIRTMSININDIGQRNDSCPKMFMVALCVEKLWEIVNILSSKGSCEDLLVRSYIGWRGERGNEAFLIRCGNLSLVDAV